MFFSGGFVQKQARGFEHDVGADLVPFERRRVTLLRQADLVAVDDQRVALDRDLTLEAAVHRVVLQHVSQVLGLEQVVDADDLDVGKVLHGGAQDIATDAAEAVDTEFYGHFLRFLKLNLAGLADGAPGAIFVLFPEQNLAHGVGDVFRREAEMLEQHRRRG